ncbi:MAG: radical SAM protein [Gammaproteobacteria bacterium]|nr:radical SAM protein [Gammaproteobacteria bacterium]
MPEQQLNLARLARPLTSLGPGRRLGLWVAGCALDCPGCISPELRNSAAGKLIGSEQLAQHILAMPEPLDGLSLSGGEPFDQAPALAALWSRLKPARPRWNLLIFSGYSHRHLRRLPQAQGLLGCCDLLIAGPYRAGKVSTEPLLASRNQQTLPLSPRGEQMLAALHDPVPNANIGQDSQGRGWLIGILDPEQRQQLHQDLGLVRGGIR